MGLGQEWPPPVAEKCLAPEEIKDAKSLFASKIVKKFGLAKNDRVYLDNDFKTILEKGTKVYADGIVLWYRSNPFVSTGEEYNSPSGKKYGRIGIIVSKKLGNAVCRNRCKRLLREVFRLNRHLLTDGADCIFCPKDETKIQDFDSACAAFWAVTKKAGILKNRKDL